MFQELPSYIKESAPQALANPINQPALSASLGSLNALAAKFSFMRGLMSTDWKNCDDSQSAGLEAVNFFHKSFLAHPKIFHLNTDFNYRLKQDPYFQKLILELNANLMAKGLNTIEN